jgi:hypothetical protein
VFARLANCRGLIVVESLKVTKLPEVAVPTTVRMTLELIMTRTFSFFFTKAAGTFHFEVIAGHAE